ncbi:MAG TPA: response regulator transcription factor, partial [Bacteroidia bacterium]|nr:response regulator transcription factor [Bacteroidia bacterium]
MGKEIIRIVLADAQFLTRSGLGHLFAGHAQIKVAGEATDGEELQQQLAQVKPHILIIDHQSSPDFSLDQLSGILRLHPGLKLMLVTDDQDHGRIREALSMGVHCILTKHCSPEEIVSAVIAISKDEKFFCHKVLEIILEKPASGDDCSPSNLSPREIEIIQLIASGLSTKDLADRLCLSTHTVYTHRKNIMKKLGIRSASEMIL